MNKVDLLGIFQTAFNRIQLTYASLVLWSYPDTQDFFEALHGRLESHIKPFRDIISFIRDPAAMKIACEQLLDLVHRTALTDLLPITKSFCHSSGQLETLKGQEFYQVWTILRNCFAHDMKFNFNPAEKAMLPVTWSGVTIDAAMNGKPLKHGQCSREKMRELLEVAREFVEKNLV